MDIRVSDYSIEVSSFLSIQNPFISVFPPIFCNYPSSSIFPYPLSISLSPFFPILSAIISHSHTTSSPDLPSNSQFILLTLFISLFLHPPSYIHLSSSSHSPILINGQANNDLRSFERRQGTHSHRFWFFSNCVLVHLFSPRPIRT